MSYFSPTNFRFAAVVPTLLSSAIVSGDYVVCVFGDGTFGVYRTDHNLVEDTLYNSVEFSYLQRESDLYTVSEVESAVRAAAWQYLYECETCSLPTSFEFFCAYIHIPGDTGVCVDRLYACVGGAASVDLFSVWEECCVQYAALGAEWVNRVSIDCFGGTNFCSGDDLIIEWHVTKTEVGCLVSCL